MDYMMEIFNTALVDLTLGQAMIGWAIGVVTVVVVTVIIVAVVAVVDVLWG